MRELADSVLAVVEREAQSTEVNQVNIPQSATDEPHRPIILGMRR